VGINLNGNLVIILGPLNVLGKVTLYPHYYSI
jgi:hypothetical protein